MLKKLMVVAVALAVIAPGADAQDARKKMFDDPDANACWFGNPSGCEAWARLDGNNAMGFICREIGRSDRCMPAEQVFDIMLVVNSAETLANSAAAGDPAQNQQNRFWLVLMITHTANRARAAGSDAAIEGLKAVIAAVPERIRWDGFRQALKDKGL
jgi:hypothetical protein